MEESDIEGRARDDEEEGRDDGFKERASDSAGNAFVFAERFEALRAFGFGGVFETSQEPTARAAHGDEDVPVDNAG